VVDGGAVATWRLERRGRPWEAVVQPFAPLHPEVASELEVEVDRLARFSGSAITLVVR
jgi:hypothetical protein